MCIEIFLIMLTFRMSELMTLKKFQYLEVSYELLSTSKSTSIVDFFALDMC